MRAMNALRTTSLAAAIASALALAACGGASSSSQTTKSGTTSAGPGALSAEAASAATGDIPDTQVFLTYHDSGAGYSIQYPEGWAQRGSGGDVTFKDKNNIIRAVTRTGAKPTEANVTAQLAQEKTRLPSLSYGAASTLTVKGSPVIKIRYSTLSQPNAVTGKRVQLLVDRYVYDHAGKVLIVDLGTPKGVDNVDAYKKIALSLRWL
jgi:hypothetical protein